MKSKYIFLILIMSILNFVSCKTTPISDLPQEDGIARIKKSYAQRDWTEVISDVDEYKTRYPYSKYIQEADLMQGDSYYQAERYPEAIAVYEDFIRKNPANSNVALANYRIAKCYDFQAPENVDRDQANALKAVQKYSYSIENYPSSEWIEDAKLRKEVLTKRIADNNAFIADFYWKKDLYAAALSRYLIIIQNNSEYKELISIAKQRASECYNELAKIFEKDLTSDAYVYFKNETPESLRKKALDINN